MLAGVERPPHLGARCIAAVVQMRAVDAHRATIDVVRDAAAAQHRGADRDRQQLGIARHVIANRLRERRWWGDGDDPTLETAAAGDDQELIRTTGRAARNTLFVATAATAALIVLARPMVRLLYQYGEFTSENTELVASLLVLVMAPPFRYLLGRTDYATGGSLLAVGVLHASFNASGSLDVLVGGWQHIVGVAVVAAAALLLDARRRTTSQPLPIDVQVVQR